MTTINLKSGHPNQSHLPSSAVAVALQELSTTITTTSSASLNYGEERGDAPFLNSLSSFLHDATVNDEQLSPLPPPLSPSQLFVTAGVSHGIDLVCSVLINPQSSSPPLALLEEPTYFLAAEIFRSRGYVTAPAPMYPPPQGGIDVEALASRLASNYYGQAPTLIYLIPSNHNPTGFTYPLSHRVELCELAHANQIHLIADEVYHLLSWSSSTPARFTRCITPPSPYIVSISSFTKIFSPGMRCGWIESHSPALLAKVENLGYIQSQGGVLPFVSEIMRISLKNNAVASSIDFLRTEYKRRASATVKALQKLSPIVQIPFLPLGGYFLWVVFCFPEGSTGSDFVDFMAARSAGPVLLLKGTVCTCSSERYENEEWLVNSARICFASVDEQVLEEGVKRIGEGLEQFVLERGSGD